MMHKLQSPNMFMMGELDRNSSSGNSPFVQELLIARNCRIAIVFRHGLKQ